MTEPERTAIVVVVDGSLAPDAVVDLCERVRALVESRATRPVVCDVSAVTRPDANALEALARIQLIARRAGIPVGWRNPPTVLADLLALVGFAEAVPPPTRARSGVEGERLVEQREQLGIDEEVHPGDAIA